MHRKEGRVGEPVSEKGMQMDDEFLFLWRECTSFEIRPQVIDPSKATTFATPLKTSISGYIAPTTLSTV